MVFRRICWFANLELSLVNSGTDSHTQRARKDRRKRQPIPDGEAGVLIYETLLYLGGLPWAVPKSVDFHISQPES